MKFGQKIFLVSFTLIIIAINLIGIIMINNTYQNNINREIEKNMLQINDIMRTINLNADDISYIGNIYLKNNVRIETYNLGKRTYTNFKDEDSEMAKKIYTEDQRRLPEDYYYVYIDEYYSKQSEKVESYIKDNKLFMKLTEKPSIVITLSDISQINIMKQEQIQFFIKLSLLASFLIALVLSISVGFLTSKIKKLNKAVKEVENGNYGAKVTKLGNDEIGNFGKSFNKMTDSIQKNINEIQEVSENRKRFIGNLTHEIRTPLTSIIGYSSLIKNKKINNQEVIYEYVNNIYEEGKYIEKMSSKLMDMLLLENGSIQLEEVDISKELIEIVDELKSTFPEVEYDENIKNSIDARIDKTLFKSLIFNLTKNAIHAYDNNPIVKIELNEKRQIKIIDHGKGIPKDELEKIKEPFYTLNKDRNRSLSGMGLGLPLALKITQIHNWKMKIESTENVGTIITIELGG